MKNLYFLHRKLGVIIPGLFCFNSGAAQDSSSAAQICRNKKQLKSILFTLFLLVFGLQLNFAQTTIISPTGDGGFETGATFTANGWTATTGTTNPLNQWTCGPGATTGYSNNRCAYIAKNSTLVHEYNNGISKTSHLYRNITIPAGQTIINLNFNWICDGETTYDRMRIWIVPTTFTPTYGYQITPSGTAPTGNVQVGLTNYSEQYTWTAAATVVIPAAYAGTTVRIVFEWSNDNNSGQDPPAAIDNISLISQSSACAGTPIGGNISVNPATGVVGSTYGVTATGYTTGSGLTYLWQYSDNGGGTWTNQGVATNSYSALTGMVAPAFGIVRTWRLVVTCTASASSANSTTGKFTTTYCVPTTAGGNTYYISNFTTTGAATNINNSSGGSTTGYQDFSGTVSASAVEGSTLNYSISVAGGSNYGRAIWIDLNNNGVFEPSEQLASSTSYLNSPLTGSFTIPLGTAPGSKRMRVVATFSPNNPSNPCNNSGTGEYEDYSITISPQPPCSGTPVPGNTIATPPSVIVGGSTVLSLQNSTSGIGVTYQWQSAPANTGPWTNIGGATASTLTASPTANTWYRCLVTCSGNTGTSNPVQVKVTPCISNPASNDNNGITSVTMDTVTFPVADVTYYNYTGTVPNLAPGAFVNSSITFDTGYTYDANIWIDFNDDAVFSTSELVFSGTSTNGRPTTLNTSFLLSLTAQPGQHYMRIGTADSGQNPPNPCYNGSFGVTIDLLVNVPTPLPCSGTPTGGNATANPNSGPPSSVFTASVAGSSFGLGLTYQWESAPSPTGPWSVVPGATTASSNITAPAAVGVTTYYRRRITCTNSTLSAYSSVTSFTTAYCSSTVTPGDEDDNYILDIRFRGTLLDTSNTSTYSTAPAGYQDFTGLATKSKQADGNGVNVYMGSKISGFYKAWIDWDKNGIFSPSEVVYNANGVVQASTTFGYVIPTGTAPGFYRLRLRVNGGDSDADPCGVVDYPGETEDYLFEVVSNCPSNILTAPRTSRCGTGSVALQPSATAGVTEFRWYNSEGDTVPFATTPSSGNTTTFNTPSISSTTVYWVTAFNGTCESLVKIPMVAAINATPTIAFTPPAAAVCESDVTVALSATGSNQVEFLIQDDFEDGTLAPFTNLRIRNVAGTAAIAEWQPRTSIFKPAQQTWKPAISSGINGNKFVMATSDVGTGTTENALVSPVVNSTGYTNLTLSFTMYYSRYYLDDTNPNLDYVAIEVSTNGGTTYPNVLETIRYDVGIGTKFETKTYDLSAYVGQPNLRFRIRYHGEWCDGVAVDNIDLFGEKPLTPSFAWTSNHPVQFYTDAAGTLPYTPGNPASSIYLKFTDAQLEAFDGWTVAATASLTNGCSAVGNIAITNNAKIWNTASTDWNSPNWKPATAVPSADKCVVIKTPVTVNMLTNGLAKNLTVKSGGKLDIAGNLTVTDYVKNENANADNLTVKSDGNLIQINPTAPNAGSINAERDVTDMDNVSATQMDYVYWSSPVLGQKTKNSAGLFDGFSPGTPNNRFFRYNEPDDRFYETGDLTFVPGKGYAVQAETSQGFPPNAAGYSKTYHFRGTPNNGDISFNINRSPDAGIVQHGFNLIGNPYPSNIDFNVLYANNSAKIFGVAYFWTNNSYEAYQLGSGYGGNNYAVYNGVGGSPATHAAAGSGVTDIPNGIVKVGQGFIIQKRNEGGPVSLDFKNSYGLNQNLRVTSSGTFFERDGLEKNRIWLNLVSPTNLVNTLLIGYIPGATDSFEQDYDAEILGMSSDLFYSKVEDKKVLIQGKGDFVPANRVKLGANFFKNGLYTIALDHAEGIFAAGQNIYLKDIQTSTVTNLSEGPYVFSADAGVSEGRFEIIYEPETVLATDGISTEDLLIYRESGDFVAQAKTVKIKKVEVYDLGGRLIYSHNTNDLRVIIPAEKLPNNVYILKVTQNERVTNKKILK